MPDPVWRSPLDGLDATGRGVRLTDASVRSVRLVPAHPPAVPFGLVERRAEGGLALGYGYDEVLLYAAAPVDSDETIEVGHGLAGLRVSGAEAAALLSRVCPQDLDDGVTPDGTLRRCPVAGIAVTLVRDDQDGERSYLLLLDRSYGTAMAEALLDAGWEFGLT